LAFTVLFGDWNWQECEFLIGEALKLNPNFGFAHECLSNLLIAQGRLDEAVVEIRRAEELDPVSPRAILMTSWALYQARQYDEAVAKARKANAMQDNFAQALIHLGNSLEAKGDLDEAVSVLRQAAEIWSRSGMPRYMLCFARAAQGKQDAVQSILDKLLQTAAQHHMKPYFIAMAYVATGDLDTAFEWFERALEEKNEWLIWIGVEPKLDAVRNDPRFLRLLEKTNNPLAVSGPLHDARPVTGERERSIAVLPFRLIGVHDTGGRSDEEYLSLGLADAVTMRLSNIRRFLVRPTSSVLPFAGRSVDPFKAGSELGVEFVVDGIIRHVGDRIRVTAQLLNVEESSTRWSASFSERYVDVLELEDSISEQVTKQLVPYLTGEERQKLSRRGTNSPEAHDAYLQGRYFWNQFTPGAFPKSIAAFRKAVEIDPQYALAHVGIADYYTWACIYGMLSPLEGFPKVLEYASRALAIDDSLAEAHAALGLYYSNMQEWAKAEECYRHAVKLNPNYPLGHEWLSATLVGTGKFDEGLKEILYAEQLDPLSLRPKVLTAWHLYQTRSYDLALAKAQEIHELAPEFVQAHLQLGNILVEVGQPEKALGFSRRAVELAPDSPLPVYNLCFSLAANGKIDEARAVIAAFEEKALTVYTPPYFIGMAHLSVGNIDKAFEYLEASRVEKSAWVLWYGSEPKLDRVRSDPRYIELLRATENPMLERFTK
jgi:tetratricopeptide (TPR) repeat protein